MTEPANVFKVQFGPPTRNTGSTNQHAGTRRRSNDGDAAQPDNPPPLPLTALTGQEDDDLGGEVLAW